MDSWKLVIGNKNYSSWSLRPWLVLKHAGVHFAEVRIPLHQPATESEISRYSPSGKVPTLIAGDTVIWESLAICEYVAERFPAKRLWPRDAEARAYARAVANEMHAGFANLRNTMPMDIRSRYERKSLTPEVATDIKRIEAIWADCRKRRGKQGDLLFGEFTIADAMFAPVVTRLETYDVPVSAASREYMDAMLAVPHFHQWIADAKLEKEVIAY
jgi:glutathione S-transferase